MFFANTIQEELHVSAPRTRIHIKPVALHKQFTKFPERAPAGAFVKPLCADMFECGLTPKTTQRQGCGWLTVRVHIAVP
jgi:hypothetical protein